MSIGRDNSECPQHGTGFLIYPGGVTNVLWKSAICQSAS
jgi:hypothetical protein